MTPERLFLETSAMKVFVLGSSENTTDSKSQLRLEYEGGQQVFDGVEQMLIFILTRPEIFSSDDYDEFLVAINS